MAGVVQHGLATGTQSVLQDGQEVLRLAGRGRPLGQGSFASGRLLVRHGKPHAETVIDLPSLGSAAASLKGVDAEYGTGWTSTNIPMMTGTPDVTGDGIPDIWALDSAGKVRFYKPSATDTGAGTTVIVGGWEAKKAFG